ALIAAFISLVGYVALGFTESVVAGLVACSVAFVISIIVLKIKSKGAIS
ncbi:MAG TPA: sodium:proton antiporter, partial [Shewanella sp.]|nr:sodium:proton antiporter [Shewanella sp.]